MYAFAVAVVRSMAEHLQEVCQEWHLITLFN